MSLWGFCRAGDGRYFKRDSLIPWKAWLSSAFNGKQKGISAQTPGQKTTAPHKRGCCRREIPGGREGPFIGPSLILAWRLRAAERDREITDPM